MSPKDKKESYLAYKWASFQVDSIIIGAGISGMCIAIDMIKRGNGRNFVIFEKSSQVGGTWNDNIYPGCCCDVWGHLYSYSFEPNPDWTREYPSQEELQKYLVAVAHKWQLYKHIRFNTSVDEARWDNTLKKWTISVTRHGPVEQYTSGTQTFTAEFLVSADGQLSLPQCPSIRGIGNFEGKIMHSARWDWDYDLTGKRVVVIGTGSTAAQIIPAIAPYVKDMVVFQRSPTWVLPRGDRPISATQRFGYRHIPGLLRRKRRQLMDLRESHFQAGFDIESEAHRHIMELSRNHMQTQLTGSWNAELRCKLTPNYPFSCKRIIVSDDFYPALARRNVRLETSPVQEIRPSAIEVSTGTTYEADAIILATGFQTSRFLHPISIYGRSGQSLESAWAANTAAYLGITVSDFPNMAILYGPNTNLAYNSLILAIEAQSRYIIEIMASVLSAKRLGLTLALEPRSHIVAEYNEWMQERLAKSTFADSRCHSWFKTSDGKIINNWCGSVVEYQERTSYVDWRDFTFSGSAAYQWRDRRITRWRRVVEESSQRKIATLELIAFVFSTALVLFCYARAGGFHSSKQAQVLQD